MNAHRTTTPNPPEVYDEDYFERGLATGVSCYTNYRWLPELTIPLAYRLIRTLKLDDHDKVLDFGCAKGYLVKALRLLGVDAYGCDISEYALTNVDTEVREFCKRNKDHKVPFDHDLDWILAKDVLEHFTPDELAVFLQNARSHAKSIFAITPLGENGRYNAPLYELDVTHKIAENPEWWTRAFERAGWKLRDFRYRIPGIKDNWARYETGNGFFTLTKP